ncbi:MAG: hypothetical protein KDK25_09395, partial [Leptospiraceae bacterium]|nr:hypothetical protein [Leptospiraceae bacterium]
MKTLQLLTVSLSVLLLAFCSSTEDTLRELQEIPPEFKRSGMISSNTYQVYMQIFATSAKEAQVSGLAKGRKRAMELITREPFLPRYPTYQGKLKLEAIINSYGRVVRVHPINQDYWGVVFQVHKIGLREEFR